MLSAGGEDALQMKDLAQRAGVSLATLYRYFPAKDHVLLGILLSRYSLALARVTAEVPSGATPRDRVTSHLLREFRAEQREPRLTAALSRVLRETSRSYSEVIERVEHLHLQMLERMAGAGPSVPSTASCCRSCRPFSARLRAAARRCQLASAGAVRDQDRLRLLDLPDGVVAEESLAAVPAS